MPTQIRIYTINRSCLAQFAQEWREKIYPLRRSLGFQIHGAYTVEKNSQFVWLLSHDGPESWEEADQAYYRSPARLAMEPNPARLIARAEEYFVAAVPL